MTVAKKVVLKFRTDAGKDFNVTVNNAADALFEEGGDALVRAALDALMTQQPFNITLASKTGAVLTTTDTTEIEPTAA
ncbi:MAG: DUF2922 family protein [Synergistaceae bacterium]|nr:DUF2922 family protein [Synergistaceae bacterium]